MRILTWNLERKKVTSPLGCKAVEYLYGQSPDIMTLSETRTDFPRRGGYTIWSKHPGKSFARNERKVLLWSKSPWVDVDNIGLDALPKARFVSGETKVRDINVRVIGVCIPWHMANVKYGSKDKAPWEDHKIYLDLLPIIIAKYSGPLIIAGDFNQAFPRIKYGNSEAAEKMKKTFKDFHIVSQGVLPELKKAGIDHIAVNEYFTSKRLWGWPNVIKGDRLSDHDGAGCELQFDS